VGAGPARAGPSGAAGREVEGTLRAVPGVQRVERDARDPRLWVVTASGDVREALTRSLVEAGIPIWHLRRRGEELDEIYRRYFQEAGDGRGD
jgi:ABC-2 type transport system ATP-binding protein